MITPERGLKIGEVELRSGVPRSTVHHYVNIGLLPAPRMAGPKLHLFDDDHLARLAEIGRLRNDGWSLTRIRTALLDFRAPASASDPNEDDDGNGSEASLRERILQTATTEFAARGYDAVRLSDIARALGIGKATIYRHFASKQALFVAAVRGVRFTLIPKAAREKNDRRGDPRTVGKQRAAAVLGNFEAYRSFNQLLGSLSHGSDPRLARQARAELHAMITNAQPFLERLIEAGVLRAQDPELLAYMLWGALMGAGECLARDGRLSEAQVLQAYLTFTERGAGP